MPELDCSTWKKEERDRMASAASEKVVPASSPFPAYRGLVALACLVVLFGPGWSGLGPSWAKTYPDSWVIPVSTTLTRFVAWLQEDATLGFMSVKDFTRAIGDVLNAPVLLLKGLLVSGFAFDAAGSLAWQLPPLSWVGVSLVPALVCLSLGKRYLAAMAFLSFLYVALFGLWESTMLTVSSIAVSVILGILFGVLLGIAAYKWRALDMIIMPVLDFMQTMPVFAYLVPALVMFGYGPAAALIVTLIYAVPPMARVTKISLSRVTPEVLELSKMAGCSSAQTMWRVMLPSIKPRLMVGVNQVIMLTLNMVIIGSLIGAGGLGYDVWQSLKALRIGEGAEAGIAITLLAIVLDRISQEVALRRPIHATGRASFLSRHGLLVQILLVLSVTTLIGAFYSPFAAVPQGWFLSTGRFWDNAIDWVNVHFFPYIDAVRSLMFFYILKPTKDLVVNVPWLGAVIAAAIAGYRLGHARLAILSAVQVFFIAAVGLWPQAMVSVYLVGVSVFLACLIGIPIGIACAWNDRLNAVVKVVIDTLQTLPSFVYLIPVIMLFSVGEFSAIVAVVLYAVVPAIRYTAHGIRSIRRDLIEAPVMMGSSPMQIVSRVQIPLALPEIMLGVNQTLMMALSMLVITALVGTRDLGQETLVALSKVDAGRGLIAGVCVVLIAMTSSRMITAWADRYKRRKGLA
jgi:glycine betaine/proline transport system permease protein